MNEPWRDGGMAAAVWGRGLDATLLLSQARHALSLILALLAARGIATPRVFVPGYYCESALGPLRQSSAELVFYPVTRQMGPDFDGLKRLTRDGAPHLIVLTHLFGVENRAAAEMMTFAASHGALVLEDATHLLAPVGGIGSHGHFVSYSPRKYLNQPDGAVVAVRGAALAAEAQAAAARMGSARRSMHGPRFALLRDRYLPWRVKSGPAPALDFDHDPVASGSSPDFWMSEGTRGYLERLGVAGIAALAERELAAAARIEDHVARTTSFVPLSRSAGAVPYFLGLRAADRATTEAELAALRRAGANASTWPDMPPEVRAEPERYGAALELRNTVIRIYTRYFQRRRPLDFMGEVGQPD